MAKVEMGDLNIGAAKADLWRYAILYKNGGVYLDIDSEIYSNLDSLIENDDIAVISREGNPNKFVQWCLMFDKNHPILENTIKKCVYNILNRTTEDILKLTGPDVFSEAVKEFLSPLNIDIYNSDDSIINQKTKTKIYSVDYKNYCNFKHANCNNLYKSKVDWRTEQKSISVFKPKKKIAICLFGLPRFYKDYKTSMDKFYDGFDIDYYIHSWGDEKILNELKEHFNPKEIQVQPLMDFSNYFNFELDMSKNDKGISNTLSPLYSIERLGNLLEKSNTNYDFVCLTRYDFVCLTGKPLKYLIKDNIFYTSYVKGDIWVIRENHDNHVDATFFCSDKNSIVKFTKLFSNLKKYLCIDKIPLCHHRLMYNHLKQIGVNLEMLKPDDKLDDGGWHIKR